MADIEEYIPRMFPRWDTGELVEIRYPKEALEQPAQTYEQGFKDGYDNAVKLGKYLNQAQEPVATIQQFERKWIDKEALEQPAQEPVELEEALKHCDGKDCECYAYYQGECSCDVDWTPEEVVKLRYQLNNTHSHQWQGLTDDEIDVLEHNDFTCWGRDDLIVFGRAIEQALKEKNHGS